jgi:hypothetical protein
MEAPIRPVTLFLISTRGRKLSLFILWLGCKQTQQRLDGQKKPKAAFCSKSA